MGCFFACFRIKADDQRKNHLVSNPFPARSRDPVVARKQLASVFLWEGSGYPRQKAAGRSLQESIREDGLDREIKNEAKFLKSIGTLPETPSEIRKASGKTIIQTTEDDGLSSNSYIPDTFVKKLDWEEQHYQTESLAQLHGSSGPHEHIWESCNSEEHQTLRKAKHFEGHIDDSGVELAPDCVSSDISPSRSGHINPIVSNHSPNSTPLKLTDEMQTPGTVYPASLESPRTRKDARIRTQYVYPVLNPVLNPIDNSTQRELPRENSNKLAQMSALSDPLISCTPNSRERVPVTPVLNNFGLTGSMKSPCTVGKMDQNQVMDSTEKSAQDKDSSTRASSLNNKEQVYLNPDSPQLVTSSLSQWLKPPLPKDERRNNMTAMDETSPSGKSSDADRPIIGLVAAHWNDNEPSHISPKWWDGNGIPNSTNKYKEDQKVSWHATPFEERLEKALSDEKLFPQRNPLNSKPIQFEDEDEESDTTAS